MVSPKPKSTKGLYVPKKLSKISCRFPIVIAAGRFEGALVVQFIF